MPLAPGTLLNSRYRIISILGQGGMGAVYRASDEHLHIPVAVKENLFLSEEYGRQFQREAHILAGLRHANLPHVTDYFAIENQIQYLVMDYIEGEDLRQRMERMGALPERETILIGISICDALSYLHTRYPPIVHRDIKPGNIKVTADGQAVLVDFGLAKIMEGSQVTSTGARAMTPGYSPPEQYGTARTDARSDIYSLGATLYATLTGVIPEDGLARMTGKSQLTPIRDLMPKINRKLAEAIEHALELDPEDRFQSADLLKKELIESGELLTYFQERPSITPPPELTSDGEAVSVPGESIDLEEISKRRERSQRKQRFRNFQKRWPAWIQTAFFAVVIAAVFLLFIFGQNLPDAVRSYFTASPTTPNATEIASIENGTTQTPAPTEPQSAEGTQEIPGGIVPSATPGPTLEQTPAPAITFTPTATPQGGGVGQIAFASDKSGIMEVWLLDINNPKNQRQLTDHKDGACQPTWSPDGLRLAFISPCKSKQESYPGSNIYILTLDPQGNPDGSSVMQLTSSLEGGYDPAWSPDGKRIAYTSLIGNNQSAIMVFNLEDKSVTELSRSNKSDKQPAWSPDGMQIAYVRQFLNSQIWYMMANGELQRQFTFSGPVNNQWPAWSIDRDVIFYSQMTQSEAGTTIPLLTYKRYEDREITNTSVENRIPSDIGPVAMTRPSPDGFWLAFESWPKGDNHDIYIMNVNGSNQTRLTTDPGFDFGPVWRPLQVVQQP